MAKLYFVGDSTVSSFHDVTYYYPRYGYGTQMYRYFDIEICNLALSGRSSKSFLKEENYQILRRNLKKGDFLVIGFGHNDEKDDDKARFTSALLPLEDEGSFAHSLYENYIRPALSVGAVPVLCTPVPRIDPKNEYQGNVIHDTENGNYVQAVISLAERFRLLSVDLTTPSVNLYQSIGYDEAISYHAVTGGLMKENTLVLNPITVDKTHLNMLGAAVTAYFFAEAVRNSDSPLKKYLKKEITMPEKSLLERNPEFKIIPYYAPKLKEYHPEEGFASWDGWYGTAFGDTDVSPSEAGFTASLENGVFTVGQKEKSYGKMIATADGMAFLFRQVPVTKNFRISAHMEVLRDFTLKQAGCGIMLRDDTYICEKTKRPIATNFIASGFLTSDISMNVLFSRSLPVEIDKEKNVVPHLLKKGDTAELALERLGQAVMVSVSYEGVTYKKTYMDFDLTATDKDYVYIGFFGCKGALCSYSNVSFEITGDAKEA